MTPTECEDPDCACHGEIIASDAEYAGLMMVDPDTLYLMLAWNWRLTFNRMAH